MSSTGMLVLFGTVCLLFSCSSEESASDLDLETTTWKEISEQASGTTVNFMMWQGSPVNNEYINNYVIPQVKKRYDMNLQISGGQGPEIVQLIMGEKEAGVNEGQIDMVWINGETFFQLRKIKGLWGPFVESLPNAKYIDFTDPHINTDFQQPVDYMECPWGISQYALIYDTARVENPPKNLEELEKFVKANPGTFTISNDFSGMSLLKCMLAELGGSPTSLDGPFDEEKYLRLSGRLWNYLNRLKPYFWKEGTTFPKEHSKMDQMFASGELYLSFGFGEGGVEEKVRSGLYPKSTRGYAWENGTVLNANYLGITYNAPNKAGAMQVINFLISPEAQYARSDIKGTDANTVLDIDKLPVEWQKKFNSRPKRIYGPTREELAPYSIKEPAPEYMIRMFEDFRTEVIEK